MTTFSIATVPWHDKTEIILGTISQDGNPLHYFACHGAAIETPLLTRIVETLRTGGIAGAWSLFHLRADGSLRIELSSLPGGSIPKLQPLNSLCT
jgi:hypothetical protein